MTAVLARIIAAHRREAIAARDRSDVLARAWTRALRHAGQPFGGLNIVVGSVAVTEHGGLSDALAALPEHGLVSALEDRDGRRGLVALSHGMVDALIEVQTTGKVEARGLPPRTVTRIDEALTRDFIDLSLAALSHETDGIEDRDWPRRMTFGSHIPDRRQLTLLIPEGQYHVLSAELALGQDGGRAGQGIIVLPSDPALIEGRPTPPERRAPGPPPETWRETIAGTLGAAEIPLEAVLLRTTRSLRDVERLAEGDLIPFSSDDLARVDLQTSGGRHLLTGRLGQMNGNRALRVLRTVVQGDGDGPGDAMVGGAAGGGMAGLDLPEAPAQIASMDAAAPATVPASVGMPDAQGLADPGLPPDLGPPADPMGGGLPPLAGDGFPAGDTDGAGAGDGLDFNPAPAPMPMGGLPGGDPGGDPGGGGAEPSPLDFAPRTAAFDPGDLPG